jgi:uncharacterized protein (TIGR02145 family)
VADGFYRNEVTGENSAATIKLRALTNRQNHANTNINLVTHLEYDRVQRLVTKEDSTVQKAKKAAEREIFAAFGIDNKDFKGFAEDYNILEEGDGNAALLAISALLQGDRNESELTALLAALSVDLGDNGVWDNKQQRAEIADWAMKKDIDGGLAAIRANIKAWKLRDSEPPAFEGHFRNFWMQELGVDECNKDNAGTLFAVKNANSKFYAAKDSAFAEGDRSLVRLICDASGDDPAWRFATDIEKDTAAFATAGDGAVANGKIDTGFVYVKEDGSWRRGTELDASLDAACVNTIKNTTTFTADATDTTWYICVVDGSNLGGYTIPTSWRLAKEAEADTAQFGIPKTAADSIKQGHINKGRFFVYEENGWRRGTENDYLLGKACLGIMNGEVFKTAAGQFYTCTNEEKILSDGVKIDRTWRASTAEEADYYFAENPDQEGAVMQGDMDKSRIYVFENDEWRRGTNLDWTLREGCIGNKVGTVKLHGDKYYTCTAEEAVENGIEIANTWRLSNADEADTLGWSVPTTTKDSVKTGNVDKTRYYVYEGGWRFGTYLDEDLGPCTSKKLNKVVKSSDDAWYKCVSGGSTIVGGKPVAREWRKATDYEVDTYSLSATATVGTYVAGPVNDNLHYVMDSYGWRPATDLENAGLESCTNKQKDNVKSTSTGVWYKCTNEVGSTIDGFVVEYTWRKATDYEMDTHNLIGNNGDIKKGNVNNLYYVKETYGWRPALDLENTKLGACTKTQEGAVNSSDSYSAESWYKCTDDFSTNVDGFTVEYTWRKATNLEKDTLGWARNVAAGTYRNGRVNENLTYVFENKAWRHGTSLDSTLKQGCIPDNKNTFVNVSSVEWYKCVGDTNVSYEESNWTSVWRRATDLEIDMNYWNQNNTEDGTLLKGSFTGRTMVWDNGSLREPNEVELGWNKGCVKAKYGKTEKLSNGLEYTCSSTGWSKTGTFSDCRELVGSDCKSYKAVKIGNQTWMAENLNYKSGNSFCYMDKESNCTKYGRLYWWSAAMDSSGSYWPNPRNGCGYNTICSVAFPVRGVCPQGWHLPIVSEFETLAATVGDVAKLKSTTGWTSCSNCTDDYSFSALPAGYMRDYYEDNEHPENSYGLYYGEGYAARFLTANEKDELSAYHLELENSASSTLGFYARYKNDAYSIRCIRND